MMGSSVRAVAQSTEDTKEHTCTVKVPTACVGSVTARTLSWSCSTREDRELVGV